MLSRLIPKPSHFRRFFSLPYRQPYFPNSPINPYFTFVPKPYSSSSSSSNNNNSGNGKDRFTPNVWGNFGENEEKFDSFFGEESGSLAGMNDGEGDRAGKEVKEEEEKWWLQEKGIDNEDEDSIFKGIGENESGEKGGGVGGDHIGLGAENLEQPWSLREEEEEGGDVFDFQEEDVSQVGALSGLESERKEDAEKLEKEEQALIAVLKG